ncbi:sugar phosphate nucleotidyltransferase [Rugamonas rubra]|uniref:D-glycero-alpha-D-manno-heptose 1-phosphate guanylyltransferase n=1 Tax=Rugamonas rubra TaxID=758825 RepID=A0A1I4N073_9BURK|nr:sugar phosphate nucleotidyltransferase [Rugamonas rubra]SFM08939.1 D-glycero-alpha-D-manno-heptose 1-phosphate guanylyltransferase [Rugamonas rubra]
MSDGALDAVVLCGGRGTRLAGLLPQLPKPLAPVLGRPFLDYVLEQLRASGAVGRVVLATGHLAEAVERHYGAAYRGLPLRYSREREALGTGGALLLAMRETAPGAPFLLLNGDSFVDVDLAALRALHRRASSGLTLALAEVDDAARYGTVRVARQRVLAFVEKSGLARPGVINAGVYLVEPAALAPWAGAAPPLSLETQIMPALVAAGRVHALHGARRFIDIGVPDSYAGAAGFFAAAPAPPR